MTHTKKQVHDIISNISNILAIFSIVAITIFHFNLVFALICFANLPNAIYLFYDTFMKINKK